VEAILAITSRESEDPILAITSRDLRESSFSYDFQRGWEAQSLLSAACNNSNVKLRPSQGKLMLVITTRVRVLVNISRCDDPNFLL